MEHLLLFLTINVFVGFWVVIHNLCLLINRQDKTNEYLKSIETVIIDIETCIRNN